MRIRTALLVLAIAGLHSLVQAAPGDPDPAFGVNGVADVRIGESDDLPVALLRREDGRLIAVGRSGDDVALARYLPDGMLDSSFGNGGLVIHRPTNRRLRPTTAVQAADGSIVVAGNCGYQGPPCLARFGADGAHDPSFDPAFPGDDPTYHGGLALQPDGKVLVGLSRGTTYGVYRFSSDGALDAGFGNGGRAEIPVGDPSSTRVVLVQADGRIIVSSQLAGSVNTGFVAARFHANGSFDSSFAMPGFPGSVATGALQPDGKILLGGCQREGAPNYAAYSAIYRLDIAGSPDLTFGTAGVAAVPSSYRCIRSMIVRGDGRVAVATSDEGLGPNFGSKLLQFTASGALDGSFGAGGQVPYSVGGGMYDAAAAVVLQPDGKLVMAGTLWVRDFALSRYATNGVLDAGFGAGGITITDFRNGRSASLLGVRRVNDRYIVVAALSSGSSPDGRPLLRTMGVARLLGDGAMDGGFGSGGQLSLDEHPVAFAVQADGKIVFADNDYTIGLVSNVKRLNADGTPDSSFGTAGKWTLQDGWISSMEVLPDGRIVVAGRAYVQPGSPYPFVARLLADGMPDAGFGANGVARFQAQTQTYSSIEVGNSIAVQADGKLLIGNVSGTPASAMRVLANGSLDPTFGNGGIAVFADASGEARSVMAHSDGRVTLAGSGSIPATLCRDSSAPAVAFARMNSSGAVDAQTTGAGYLVGGLRDIHPRLRRAALDAADRVVAVGTQHLTCVSGLQPGSSLSRTGSIAMRFTPSGALDTRFGADGIVTLAGSPDGSSSASSVRMEPDGRILAAVSTSTGYSSRLTLHRLHGGGDSAPIGPPDDIDNDGIPNQVEASARSDPFVAASGADMSVEQSVNASPGQTGKDVVLTMTARNLGVIAASNVVVTVSYGDISSELIWASPGCARQGLTAVFACGAGSVAPGDSRRFMLVMRRNTAGSIWSAATVRSDSDTIIGNNSASLTVAVNASPAGVPVLRYRLYSPVTLEHHFTTDVNEYNVLGSYTGTWQQEGTVGKVLNNPGSFGGVTAVPYYRLFNTTSRWHHWTTDPNEHYTLIQFPGWISEGVDGYILPAGAPGTMPIYRLLYPPIAGLHHWTVDVAEYNALITAYGWIAEGGTGFVIQ